MATKKPAPFPPETLAIYDKLVSGIKDLERKGAAMPYTSVNGNMFSFLAGDGSLALRLPAAAKEEFIKKHKTVLREAHGIVMKEYVVVPDKVFKDTKKMAEYFRQSYEYVSSLKSKTTTKPARAKKAPSK